MTVSVAVAGASGYAGGEIIRLLTTHPGVRIGALTAHSQAGSDVAHSQPHLRSLAGRTFTPTTPEHLLGHDVVFLALPHGASGGVAAELAAASGGAGPLVIDVGADHRLTDAAAWEAYYGGTHAGSWPYGLPELITPGGHQRDHLAGANRIAVPGCNVTAVTLGIQPGVAAGLIDTGDLVAVLANGYSGAGKAMKTHLLASEAFGSASPYAVGGTHRHIPEIEQNLLLAGADAGVDRVRISFTPTLVPMARGILATITAPLTGDPARVRPAWEAAYSDEPFVHVLAEGQWPATAMTTGANTALMQVAVDERAGRVVVVVALDNLVKGTAGAAIQSMNLAVGLPETVGLPLEGVAP